MILFDQYRDKDTRDAMIEYVARTRFVSPALALVELQLLNFIGLAYVHRDMLKATGQAHMVDYDPCQENYENGR